MQGPQPSQQRTQRPRSGAQGSAGPHQWGLQQACRWGTCARRERVSTDAQVMASLGEKPSQVRGASRDPREMQVSFQDGCLCLSRIRGLLPHAPTCSLPLPAAEPSRALGTRGLGSRPASQKSQLGQNPQADSSRRVTFTFLSCGIFCRGSLLKSHGQGPQERTPPRTISLSSGLRLGAHPTPRAQPDPQGRLGAPLSCFLCDRS